MKTNEATEQKLIALDRPRFAQQRAGRGPADGARASVWILAGYFADGNGEIDSGLARAAADDELPREAVEAAPAYYRQHKKYIDARRLLNENAFGSEPVLATLRVRPPRVGGPHRWGSCCSRLVSRWRFAQKCARALPRWACHCSGARDGAQCFGPGDCGFESCRGSHPVFPARQTRKARPAGSAPGGPGTAGGTAVSTQRGQATSRERRRGRQR